MKSRRIRFITVAGVVTLAAAFVATEASNAARVGVLSNNHAAETAAEFNATVAGHTFSAVNVATTAPTLQSLTASFDIILLFEDSTFVNSTTVGNVVAQYANTGRPVVLGTFYDQDRSDAPPSMSSGVSVPPHGWGTLESLDPNTTDGIGTPYTLRTLDTASIVTHPLTTGVTALTSGQFGGGNQPKAGTIVVAKWTQKNARGGDDPAIAYRITGPACVIHVAIAPDYPTVGVAGVDFGGDFYRVWRNAFDFGAANCVAPTPPPIRPVFDPSIPTLSPATLAITAFLLLLFAALSKRLRR